MVGYQYQLPEQPSGFKCIIKITIYGQYRIYDM